MPLAAWAGVLLLRPSMPDAKRFVLFLIGTALLITIVVEVVVVRGDIGRANTIFKFYLQAWILLAVSAGAAFAWTLPAFFKWLPGWQRLLADCDDPVDLRCGIVYCERHGGQNTRPLDR